MQLSKVTYALIAAGVMGGVATYYNQISSGAVSSAVAATPPALVRARGRAGRGCESPRLHGAGRSRRRRRREHRRRARQGPRRRRCRRPRRGQPVPRVLQALRRRAERSGNAPGAAATVAGHGLGLHREHRRLHRHQRARRRRRDRSHGEADRPPRVHGQGHRRRQAHRHRAHQDRSEEPAGARHFGEAGGEARRMGDRDRLAVRVREQRVRGRGQRRAPRAAERADGAVHPDRRRRESGQLRRSAAQRGRPGRRRELADLQPLGRLHGPVVRDSGRGRVARRRPDQDARQGAARTPGNRHPGPRPDAGTGLRPRRRERGGGRQRREGQPGREGGLQVRRRDPQDRRHRGDRQHGRHEPHRQHGPGHDDQGRGVARRQAGRTRRPRSARSTTSRSRRPTMRRKRKASSAWPCVR